jgi:hypothetical protein
MKITFSDLETVAEHLFSSLPLYMMYYSMTVSAQAALGV